MNARWRRFVALMPPHVKRPSRLNLLGFVLGVTALVLLEGQFSSVHSLCLIFTPPRVLAVFTVFAVGWLVCNEASQMKDREFLALAILIGFGVVCLCVELTGAQVLKRIDTLEERLAEIESGRTEP
jgi:uncharacterized membrane protein